MANLARVAPTGTGEFSASRERETKREKEIDVGSDVRETKNTS